MSCYITWNTCIALTTVIPGISPAAGNGISLSKTIEATEVLQARGKKEAKTP
jgi:hypothetical protein